MFRKMFLIVSIISSFPAALCDACHLNIMKRSVPALPTEFICPISLDLMTDPVVASDGFTYERECITKWFSEHNTSPTTNAPLNNLGLIENRGLRNLILELQHEVASKVCAPSLKHATSS